MVFIELLLVMANKLIEGRGNVRYTLDRYVKSDVFRFHAN